MIDLSQFSSAHFERGASRAKEAIWLIFKWAFFCTTVPWPSSVRAAILRIFGARIGENVVIRANVSVSFPWRLTLGDHVWLGEEVMILSLSSVVIESHCCVSQRAFICTGSHDFQKPSFDLKTAPIHVGSGTWIAAQAFIGPGVKIGGGSVIGAGSVVMKNVPANVLVQGNPPTVIRSIIEGSGDINIKVVDATSSAEARPKEA